VTIRRPGCVLVDGLERGEHDHAFLAKEWQTTGFGYALEHGTRPATIGLVQSSSPPGPAGLGRNFKDESHLLARGVGEEVSEFEVSEGS
jgi:hypothetical protein